MSKRKSTAATTETTTRAIEHSGQTIRVNGVSIDIPLSVEVAGPRAVQDYLVEQCASRGVSHVPEPRAAETAPVVEQPTAPAPTSSTRT